MRRRARQVVWTAPVSGYPVIMIEPKHRNNDIPLLVGVSALSGALIIWFIHTARRRDTA